MTITNTYTNLVQHEIMDIEVSHVLHIYIGIRKIIQFYTFSLTLY